VERGESKNGCVREDRKRVIKAVRDEDLSAGSGEKRQGREKNQVRGKPLSKGKVPLGVEKTGWQPYWRCEGELVTKTIKGSDDETGGKPSNRKEWGGGWSGRF